jgi:FolB domain-containing protein
MDKITLLGVECKVKLGVPAEERAKRQKVLIDVIMEADCSAAAAQDDFRKAVDYWAIEKLVRETAERGERRLAERLAEDVAAAVLTKVSAVTVKVRKKPYVMPKTAEVIVEIARRR